METQRHRMEIPSDISKSCRYHYKKGYEDGMVGYHEVIPRRRSRSAGEAYSRGWRDGHAVAKAREDDTRG